MRKRLRIAPVLLLVAILGSIAWWTLHQPPEPIYQGKRLSVWLQRYDDIGANLHPDLIGHREADEAVRKIGPAAVPILLQRIQADDSSLKFRFLEMAGKQSLVKIQYTPAWTLNVEAATAFEALGDCASNAVPELIRIYSRNISTESQRIVALSLGGVGPAASNAVPLLLMRTTSTNDWVQAVAIWALGRIHAEPRTVVPELMKLLRDPNFAIRLAAAQALGEFGPHASPAFQLLNECYKSEPDSKRRVVFGEALMKIDPKTAAEAGIK